MSNYRNYGETWEVAKSTAQLHTFSMAGYRSATNGVFHYAL